MPTAIALLSNQASRTRHSTPFEEQTTGEQHHLFQSPTSASGMKVSVIPDRFQDFTGKSGVGVNLCSTNLTLFTRCALLARTVTIHSIGSDKVL